MDKFTKWQQVQAVYDLKVGYTLRHADIAILKSMARQLLASMEQEPEGWQFLGVNGLWVSVTENGMRQALKEGCEVRPLYAAPQLPQPAVPECYQRLLHHAYGMTMGQDWNKGTMAGHHRGKLCKSVEECRAAMLQGAEPRKAVRSEHAEWSQSTFGDVGPVGPLKHLSTEALEAAAEPGDLSEWADMQFLLLDAQRRAGITDEQITKAMIEKLAVNKTRIWPEPKDGEPRLHIKEAPQQELK